MSVFRNLVMTMKPPSRLPGEYQEVEYVKFNGSQYINTGYKIQTGYRTQLEMDFSEVSWQNFFGALTYSDGVVRSHIAMYNPGDGYQIGVGAKLDHWTGFTPTVNTKYTLDASTISGGCFIKINGTQYASGTDTYNFTPYNMNCYIGASNGDLTAMYKGKLYSCKLYDDNDTLIRNFVPCYRKLDNVIGFYDLITEAFFTNSGSGSFTAGPDV